MHRTWLTRLRPWPFLLVFASTTLFFFACSPTPSPDDAANGSALDETASTTQPVTPPSSRDADQLFPPCNRYDNIQSFGALPPLGQTTARPFTESYEAHRYTLDVEAGDYLHVVVEQRNVDLVVSLVNAAGEGLLRVDSLYRAKGTEEVLWLAEAAGQLSFLICSPRKPPLDGGYTLHLAALTVGTQHETRVADAFLDYHSAEAHRRRDTSASRHDALQFYHQAAEKWHELEAPHAEAFALYGIGRTHYVLQQDLELALEAFSKSAELFKSVGDAYMEGGAHSLLGLTYTRLGQDAQALEHHEVARNRRRDAGNHQGYIRSSIHLAVRHRVEGRFSESREILERLLVYARDLGEKAYIANVLHELGLYYRSLGDHEQSLELHNQSLAIRTSLDDHRGISQTRFAIGDTLQQSGQFKKAIPQLEKALSYYEESGPKSLKVETLITIGICYIELEDYDTAQTIFDEVLQVTLQENFAYSKARAHLYHGWIKAENGGCREAIEDFHLAAEFFQQTSRAQSEAIAIQNIASCYLWLEDTDQAIHFGEKAVELAESFREKALSMSWQAKFFSGRRYFFDSLIDAYLQEAEGSGLETHMEQAIELSERSKARALLDGIWQAHGATGQASYGERQDEVHRLIAEINERLSRNLLTDTTDTSRPTDVEARYLLEKLEIAMRRRTEQQAPHQTSQRKTLNIEEIRAELDEETTILNFHIGYWKGHLWLIDRERLLHFSLPNQEKLGSLIRTVYRNLSTKARPVQTDLLLEDLSKVLLTDVLKEVKTRRILIVNDGPLAYLPIDAMPLPEVSQETQGSKDQQNRRLVGDIFEVVEIPSVSVLSAIRQKSRGKSSRNRRIGIIADPVFHLEDPRYPGQPEGEDPLHASEGQKTALGRLERLIHSNREATAIARIASDNGWHPSVSTAFGASKDLVRTRRFREFDVLHFATHADFHSLQPEFAHLAFSQFGEDGRILKDSNLFVYELYNLNLNADLVVLSACSSALGSEILGEGLVGLTQGFFQAGTRQILVSLWQVDDRATAELMKHFYENLLTEKLGPAEALWQAKKAIRSQPEWQEPYFWAGFALQGDWRL